MIQRALTYFVLLLSTNCVNHDLIQKAGCTATDLILELTNMQPATNCSTSDGSVTVLATGGKQPYTYLLNDIPQDDTNFENLAPGIYAIQVRDANGCSSTLTNLLVEASDFVFSADVVEDNMCLGDNGSITINISQGNPPYQYNLDNTTFTDKNIFTMLTSGSHAILVKDVNSCIIRLNVTVPRGNTKVSWAADIKPIMNTYCASKGCHNGVSRTDLRVYKEAFNNRVLIKEYTHDRTMPFGDSPSLTQNQIDLITCWVDDGAIEN